MSQAYNYAGLTISSSIEIIQHLNKFVNRGLITNLSFFKHATLCRISVPVRLKRGVIKGMMMTDYCPSPENCSILNVITMTIMEDTHGQEKLQTRRDYDSIFLSDLLGRFNNDGNAI